MAAGAEPALREGFEIAVRLDPTTERDTLESPREVLFAASSKVDEVKKGGIESVRKALDASPSRPRSRRHGRSG